MDGKKLEIFKYNLQQKIDKKLLHNYKLDIVEDTVADYIITKIKIQLLGERLKPIQFPKNWWEMFKQQYFSKFLLKKFPVKYKIYNFTDIRLIYPEIKIPKNSIIHILNSKGEIVNILKNENL